MVRCEFVSSSSIFLSQDDWGAVEDPQFRPILASRGMPVWIGADFSLKHDSSCLAVVTWDPALQKVRLVDLKIWEPSPDSPIDFGDTFVKTLLDLKDRFTIRSVMYDPYQLAFAAQTCAAAGINMVELAQSESNLTTATTALFSLVKGRNFVTFPDDRLRKAIAHAVAKETGRGWRLVKDKRTSKIDPVVALSFACLGAGNEGPLIGDGADYVASMHLSPSPVRHRVGALGSGTVDVPFANDDPALAHAYEAELRRSVVDELRSPEFYGSSFEGYGSHPARGRSW
jgi:hypothetical protein